MSRPRGHVGKARQICLDIIEVKELNLVRTEGHSCRKSSERVQTGEPNSKCVTSEGPPVNGYTRLRIRVGAEPQFLYSFSAIPDGPQILWFGNRLFGQPSATVRVATAPRVFRYRTLTFSG